MLHTSLLGFGLDVLLGDRLGLINVSREVLLQEFYHVLPRDRTMIVLAETVQPTSEVSAACHDLKLAKLVIASLVRAQFAEQVGIEARMASAGGGPLHGMKPLPS